MTNKRQPNGYTLAQERIIDSRTIYQRLAKRGIQAQISTTPAGVDNLGNITNNTRDIKIVYYSKNGIVKTLDTSVIWHLLYYGQMGTDKTGIIPSKTNIKNKPDHFVKYVYKKIKNAIE